MGIVSHFLGLKFQWTTDEQKNVSCHINQEAFTESIIQQCDLDPNAINHPPSPYRSGTPIDSINDKPPTAQPERCALETKYRSIIGSLRWLGISTRPDIATVTNILAQH